ncbi:MAG: hypothetical protein ACLRFL_02925 [Clostridia bacterium]
MFWQNYKGYILGAILGATSIVCAASLLFTHTLEGIFLGGWLGTALGYMGIMFAMNQYDHNKRIKRNIIKIDDDLLEDESSIFIDEYENNFTINNDQHYAKNYIQKLTDKKSQEKIENRSRSVDACIIDTEENQEDNIEL